MRRPHLGSKQSTAVTQASIFAEVEDLHDGGPSAGLRDDHPAERLSTLDEAGWRSLTGSREPD